MTYDEGLAERIRDLLSERRDIAEKKMFGGLSFLLNGNLCCGVIGEELIVRVGPDVDSSLLEQPHVRLFDFTGKPMKGWLVVSPAGVEEDGDLGGWVDRGVRFAASLPPK